MKNLLSRFLSILCFSVGFILSCSNNNKPLAVQSNYMPPATVTTILEGSNYARLTSTYSPIFDFGTVSTGLTAGVSQSFLITNTGLAIASGIQTSSLPTGFSITSNNCITVAVGASCLVVVKFLPKAVGPFVGNLKLTYNGGALPTQSVDVSLKGSGIAAALPHLSEFAISPDPKSFGQVIVGTPAVWHTLYVVNDGNAALTGITISASGNFAIGNFTVLPNDQVTPVCNSVTPITLQPGSKCGFVTLFTASVPLGLVTSFITLSYSTNQSLALPVNGISAVTAANLAISANPANFANFLIGQSPIQNACITLTNQSNSVPITFTSLPQSQTLAAPFTYSPLGCANQVCGSILAPTASCDIPIQFNPTAGGNFATAFTINYNDGVSTQTRLNPIYGSALLPSTTVITMTLSKEIVLPSEAVKITLAAVNVNVATCVFSRNGQALSLPVGGEVTLPVIPPSTFKFACTDLNGRAVAIEKTVFAAIVLNSSIPTIAFGDVQVSQASTVSTTFTNSHPTSSVQLGDLTVSPDFTISATTCRNALIPPLGNCTASVSFSPTVIAAKTGNLMLGYANRIGNVSISVPITANGIAKSGK